MCCVPLKRGRIVWHNTWQVGGVLAAGSPHKKLMHRQQRRGNRMFFTAPTLPSSHNHKRHWLDRGRRMRGEGVWYLSHLTVCLFSICLSKMLNSQTDRLWHQCIFFCSRSLITAEWKIVSFAAGDKKKSFILRVSAAATSIPLMLYSWHDRRHVIVGQMVDYTNPHYSSWWGWNLDHMNLVFHFLLLYSVWNEFSLSLPL